MGRIFPIARGETMHYLGRVDYRVRDELPLLWNGSGIRVKTACTMLSVIVKAEGNQHAPWIGVLVDGYPVARQVCSPGTHTLSLLAGMDTSVPHTIDIVRDTQPIPGEPKCSLILTSLETDGELLPVPAGKLRIAFVGDSLTVGEGTVGPLSAEEWIMPWASCLPGYAVMLCQMLQAEAQFTAISGWGVYRSWDGNAEHALPGVYNALCSPSGWEEPFDFEQAPADVVIVGLGTNDMGWRKTLKGRERADFEQGLSRAVQDFLAMLRRLHPRALIVWAYGMAGKQGIRILQTAVQDHAEKTRDPRMLFVELPVTRREEMGSRSHPGPAGHRRTAGILCREILLALQARKDE